MRGERAEHERITRDALACPKGTKSTGDCFEPLSIDSLAGTGGTTGAVGAPDLTETTDPAAHCDDADYLDFAKYGIPGTYPRSRADATNAILNCVVHLSGRFSEGLDASKKMLDSKDNILKGQTGIGLTNGGSCTFTTGSGRAKCDALEGFGRALHGVQDFYSHSNWADEADHSKPISITNPPGLHLSASSYVLNLRDSATPAAFSVPPELLTGCFIPGTDFTNGPSHTLEGAKECIKQGRITHLSMNKDNGVISVSPGITFPLSSPLTSKPETSRGQIGNNFELAVEGAIIETRRQWSDFRAELVSRYGPKQASLMVCALTRDEPWKDCTGRKIALVIDSSGSNTETDPSGLRVTAAKELDATLISDADAGPDHLPDQVTVISFTDSAEVLYPIGDPAQASFAGVGADGGTYIAGGVALAIAQLTKDTQDPTEDHAGIVVFTDGQDSDISDLLAELGRAARLGIRVSFGFLSPPPTAITRRHKKRSMNDWASPRPSWKRQTNSTSILPADSLLTAILKTGGFFGTISSAEAQKAFVDLVIARGPTNINSIGPSFGGPLYSGVGIVSLTPAIGEPNIFTYHANKSSNLSFETKALSGPRLNVTLRDVEASKDLGRAVTNAQGLATIKYQASAGTDFELIVAPIAGAASNSTGLFEVNLSVGQVSNSTQGWNSTCPIAANAKCSTLGEVKCCGSGFVTCDNAGYVYRGCGHGTSCTSNGSSVYCGYP
jgi:hypothetical protein